MDVIKQAENCRFPIDANTVPHMVAHVAIQHPVCHLPLHVCPSTYPTHKPVRLFPTPPGQMASPRVNSTTNPNVQKQQLMCRLSLAKRCCPALPSTSQPSRPPYMYQRTVPHNLERFLILSDTKIPAHQATTVQAMLLSTSTIIELRRLLLHLQRCALSARCYSMCWHMLWRSMWAWAVGTNIAPKTCNCVRICKSPSQLGACACLS